MSLSASEEFRRLLSGGAFPLLKATLTLADGTEVALVGEDFALGGLSVTSATSPVGSFATGAAVVGTCSATLQNMDHRLDQLDLTGATIVPYVGATLSGGTTEWLRLGKYWAEQPDSYGSTVIVSCEDALGRLALVPYSEVATAYPATLGTIANDICVACGVELATASFRNSTEQMPSRPQGDMSCLEAMGFVAQVSGSFVRADQFGRLAFGWYDASAYGTEAWLDGGTFDTSTTPYSDGDAADGGQFMTGGDSYDGGSFGGSSPTVVSSVMSLTTATDDVVVTGVRVRASDPMDGSGAQGEEHTYGQEGYLLSVRSNPLVAPGMAETVANGLAHVVGMRFRPLSARVVGDPALVAGDVVTVVDREGRAYRACLTRVTWSAAGHSALDCSAEPSARNSAARFGIISKAIRQGEAMVAYERTARELAIKGLADQLAAASGLYETQELQPDGSVVYYMHDKPTLAESQIVWKLTANAFGISNDGGQTYPYGIDVSGTAILERVYAIGIDADYINTGSIRPRSGQSFIDLDTGEFSLSPSAQLGGKTVQQVVTGIDDAAALSNTVSGLSGQFATNDRDLRALIEQAAKSATDYLAYQDGELTIGAAGSAIKNVMTNSGQVYRTSAGDIAWFGLRGSVWEMFIETARIMNMLRFGDFAWIARSNGNMTLKWMGQ